MGADVKGLGTGNLFYMQHDPVCNINMLLSNALSNSHPLEVHCQHIIEILFRHL